LVVCARDAGVVRFIGTIHPDNAAIRRLVEKVAGPFETKAVEPGAVQIAIDLRTRQGAG
jgi:hypothetical protein